MDMSERRDREYGSLATIGLVVPQANPIVEPEFSVLLPQGASVLTARLQGSRTDSKARLLGYFETLGETLETFDIAELDVLAYACTGSTYLMDAQAEADQIARLSDRFGYPIITAAAAIRAALDHLDITSIALFAPYPQWLAEAGVAHWKASGVTITNWMTAPVDPSDTRSVYGIRTPRVIHALRDFDWRGADALLLTGTGMPTLRAISDLSDATGLPVLSSNLCLAWAALGAAGARDELDPPTRTEPLFSGWSDRLQRSQRV